MNPETQNILADKQKTVIATSGYGLFGKSIFMLKLSSRLQMFVLLESGEVLQINKKCEIVQRTSSNNFKLESTDLYVNKIKINYEDMYFIADPGRQNNDIYALLQTLGFITNKHAQITDMNFFGLFVDQFNIDPDKLMNQ